MRYSPGKPFALAGLSLNIQSGERLGVVGRTGAGKSSLVAIMLRLVEIDSGGFSTQLVAIPYVNFYLEVVNMMIDVARRSCQGRGALDVPHLGSNRIQTQLFSKFEIYIMRYTFGRGTKPFSARTFKCCDYIGR